MPELPEVETRVRSLRESKRGPSLIGTTILDVTLNWPRHVDRPEVDVFRQRIRGRRVLAVGRRGKFLVFTLDRGALIIHLRMTGDLYLRRHEEAAQPHEHTIFHLPGGWELRFRDTRKFGRVYWVEDPREVLGGLGPEPLSPTFTAERLAEKLRGRRRRLKPLLLDQSFLAGLGNIYTD
ncbi:MAG: DNA-formamidopyrimidine glycosylase family protein, partial [Anaerolineae bacterium]